MKKLKSKTKKLKQRKSEWSVVPVAGTSSLGPYPADNTDLQRRITANPLDVAAEAKYKLGELKAGYRRDLYAVLAMTVGIGRHYYTDFSSWKSFFNQSFFQVGKQKPKARTQQVNALRHTMNYVFDAKSKQARSRTGKYAAALHEIMIVGVPVHLVAAEIEEAGGIEKLYEAYLEREAHKPKKGGKRIMNEADHAFVEQLCNPNDEKGKATDDMILGDLDDGQEQSEDKCSGPGLDGDEMDEEDLLDRCRDIDDASTAGMKRGLDPEGRLTIELEVNDEAELNRFLDLRKSRSAWVRITSLGRSQAGWRRLKIDTTVWKRRRSRR